jgi:hypothetical protein
MSRTGRSGKGESKGESSSQLTLVPPVISATLTADIVVYDFQL